MSKFIKKFFAVICGAALGCTMLAVTAFAQNDEKCVCLDNSMTPSEVDDCNSKLNAASEEQGLDLVVVFVDDLEGKSMMAYADDYYDYNGYGTDSDKSGVLLLVDYATRETWISTTGDGISKLSDSDIDSILQGDVKNALASKDNTACVDAFISDVEYYSASMHFTPILVIIALGIGIVAAVITVSSINRKYKFHEIPTTANYLEGGNLDYTVSSDQFMTTHTSRVHIDTSSSGGGSSTHSGSSGTSHGGGGGSF